MNICMSGCAGDVASKKFFKENESLFKARFSSSFISKLDALPDKTVKISFEAETSEVCFDLKEGLYKALWNLGEAIGCGLEISHKLIPIKQETIEICELVEANPYEISSSGYVYVLPEGELPHEGVLIGKTTHTNDRVVLMKSGTRFLNKN